MPPEDPAAVRKVACEEDTASQVTLAIPPRGEVTQGGFEPGILARHAGPVVEGEVEAKG